MADNTKIEWCDATFNPWVGCTKVSAACDHCYAEGWAKRTGHPELWAGERRRTIQTAISAACGDVNAAAALAAPFSAIPQVASILTFAAASCAGANAVAALTTKALSDPTTVAWAENLATMLKTAVAAVKGL